jgi:FkbM family methyltransferase
VSRARAVTANVLAAAVATVPPAALRRLGRRRAPAQLVLNRALKRRPRSYPSAKTVFGFSMAGHTSDLIQRYIYVFGMWEPGISSWLTGHLRRGDVVLDIGANIGYFSLLSASLVGPEGRVLAFEPVPSIAALLEDNIRRNGAHVDVHRVIVSDVAGEAEIFRSGGTNIGRSGTLASEGSSSEGRVPVVTATEVVDADLWSRIRFVKVDVEGDERRVLRGLEKLLAELQPGAAVFVEITPDELAARGETAEELLSTMRGLGFDPFEVQNSYAAADYAHFVPAQPVPLVGVPARQVDVLFVKRNP